MIVRVLSWRRSWNLSFRASQEEIVRQRCVLRGWALGLIALGLGFDEPTPPASVVKEEPSARKPVVAGAAISPGKVKAGDTVTLVVQAKIAPTWHIYAADQESGSSIPTTLKLKLPKSVESKSDWSYPASIPNREGEGSIYEAQATFRRTLKVASDAPSGPIEVTCEFGYQACDPFTCRPPAKLTLKAKAVVVSSP